ncbi:alpha-1,2-mannosyltransferase [Streptoalloteichus tenebrarius]|uniref:Alpha-1,2-mannosyltransferase n=1 Tax=Streptoalloteichus tenebrarius (strain ATCC 17920 / DSM 40477 / JCM 4838 / CBS 697.72 / NBRC 16177 / NCIMB 11028 / NRRL B-12390 / A12253. 1 / ISP 5477) TaxID=1933 RepID=A0ABT1I087_STRSD|nr:glycosyltransferase 87 family protein [Streptoalloteichus tenebrarius]MCP2261197.1 alpha-1,2-mannosyltransferase [Streptoalloteichus tenebrarius]
MLGQTLPRFPTGRPPTLAGPALAVTTSLVLAWSLARLPLALPFVDARVYAGGVRAWRDGEALYRVAIPALPGTDFSLPFTYPPFALVPFVALFSSSVLLGVVLLTAGGLLALWGTLLVVARRITDDAPRAGALAAVFAGASLLVEPVTETLLFGQVNLLLMGMVAADCLVRSPRWPRGALVGVAAAIKLTPAVFVVFFLAHRQWRAAATTGLSFLACTLVGWVMAPASSLDYWTRAVLDPTRIGTVAYVGNQSIRGALERLGLTGAPAALAWVGLSVAVGVVALHVVRRARAAGDDVTAWLALCATTVLVSPISWSHHWVWVVPLALVLVCHAARARRVGPWRLVALVLVIVTTAPHWWVLGAQERDALSWWHQPLAASYVLMGLGLLTLAARRPNVLAPGLSRGSATAASRAGTGPA